MEKTNHVFNLREALNVFLEYAARLSEKELEGNRTLNELVLTVRESKFHADILLGDKENPIHNYKY